MNINPYIFILRSILFSLVFLTACGQDPAFKEVGTDVDYTSLGTGDDCKNAGTEPCEQDVDDNQSSQTGPSSGNHDADVTGNSGSGTNNNNGSIPGGDENGGELYLVNEQFVQKGPGKVDILWVVDNSGSMSGEQSYLGTNFSAFIDQLAKSKIDFQTAVTNSDVCQDEIPANLAERVCPTNNGGNSATHLRGTFRGSVGSQIIRPSDSNLVNKFQQYTAVGTNGSNFEHGLTAAKLAIEKVLSGNNDPLLRNDAFLAVIVVSDEEDDGIGLSQKDQSGANYHELGLTTYKFTENDFIAYLKTAKGEGKFSISTITGTRNANGIMCSAPHSVPKEEGTQYIKAAQKTGGNIQSICATNWDESLSKIGIDLGAQITQIKLSRIALPSSIKVKVNGHLHEHWQYIEAVNTIKFNPEAIPAEGANIQIEYLSPEPK